MPELPEVQTTVTGLSKTILGLTIKDVWTDYGSPYFKGSNTIKDPSYFRYFKKEVIGSKIVGVNRRAKNILIHLEKKTILIHMKMTGHIIIGKYLKINKRSDGKNIPEAWIPDPKERKALHDPFNRFIHFVITFSNKKQLVLSDVRKFAKVTLIDNSTIEQLGNSKITESEHLRNLGPEPLEKSFTFKVFKEQLNKKPDWKIKSALLDQTIISGIGNIYSDEALWRARINPEERVKNIADKELDKLYKSVIQVLKKGIDFGGDSMSDYRNIHGEKGKFQEQHEVYRRKGKNCNFNEKGKVCGGIIQRIVVGGRSTHFCPVHQKLRKI